MAFNDFFRVGVHGVFINDEKKILQLKSTYGSKGWGLPGGGVDPGETIHEALIRECFEELGVAVNVIYMSGLYYHEIYNAQVCVFKCEIPAGAKIQLSEEHSEYRYFDLEELSNIQRTRVLDCLNFDGKVKSAKF